MTKFTPKEIKGNVNVSGTSPTKDFFELVIKVLGFLVLIYIVLGLAVDYIVPRLSLDMELKIGKLLTSKFERRTASKIEVEAQKILDNLARHATLPKLNYIVHIEESKEINAIALPGGHIVILSALLKEIKSENELAMILAHELGHFAYRDHLRHLGRGLVFLVMSTVMFGTDSSISKFIANSITNVEMRFSQAQESTADIYALELLNRTYGNVAGAVDFFEKMVKKEKRGRFLYIFSSHPYPLKRIVTIKETIQKRSYKVDKKIPLDVAPYINEVTEKK